ncbi:MAG: MBL fold metallo-hydrolase [Candidatus Bathyarchaeia archaeon]
MDRTYERLGRYDERLEGISLIRGVGLTSNIYVIGRQRITLVDAGNGAYANRIAPELRGLGLDVSDVVQVVITHLHHDHVRGVLELVERASPRIMVYRDDAVYLEDLKGARVVGLREGDMVEAEGYTLNVIHTPGHMMGSICLFDPLKKILFSGDTVFPHGRFGRWDHGSIEAMIGSLGRLAGLDVDIMLPGHGRPAYRDAGQHIRLSLEAAQQYL